MPLSAMLPERIRVLMFIAEADRSSGEIYEYLDLAQGSRTRTLTRIHDLEDMGYVSRTGVRGALWHMTKRGRNELLKLAQSIATASIRKDE